MKRVDIFYDVLSPYSWLAFETLCRYRALWQIELRLRPFLLGGIMQGAGNQPPAMVPARGAYLMEDLPRGAKHFGIPVRQPKDFMGTVIQKGSLTAMRLLTAISMTCPEHLEETSRQLWLRIWSRDEDITEPDSLKAAVTRAGLTSAKAVELIANCSKPEVKERLKAETAEALRSGAFGAPWIIAYVNGREEKIFGSDRMHILAELLDEEYKGPMRHLSKL